MFRRRCCCCCGGGGGGGAGVGLCCRRRRRHRRCCRRRQPRHFVNMQTFPLGTTAFCMSFAVFRTRSVEKSLISTALARAGARYTYFVLAEHRSGNEGTIDFVKVFVGCSRRFPTNCFRLGEAGTLCFTGFAELPLHFSKGGVQPGLRRLAQGGGTRPQDYRQALDSFTGAGSGQWLAVSQRMRIK